MTINGYSIIPLDKETAEKYLADILELVKQVPLVDYSLESILAEGKDKRIFYGKWEHSFIVLDEDKPIGIVMGYEREAEGNEQYPQNTLYISELAVDKKYQRKGLGRELMMFFLNYNQKLGFKYLEGEINFSLQTNSAENNLPVQKLYEKIGFRKRSEKVYDNRTDNIYELVF